MDIGHWTLGVRHSRATPITELEICDEIENIPLFRDETLMSNFQPPIIAPAVFGVGLSVRYIRGKVFSMSQPTDIDALKKIAAQVRRDIVRMVHACQSGHPGGSLGCTEFFVALYFRIMKHDPKFNMKGVGEDLFFLSNGHISPVWYSTLARAGYFDTKELKTFRLIDSRLQGHPATHEHLPGIRIASGSLGQGLSVALGAAQAKKLDKDDRFIFVMMGDGEQQEGQIWEAAMYAAHNKLDNVIATIDYNGQQIDGPVNKILNLLDLKAKWEAFGWEVIDSHGNDMEEVVKTLEYAKTQAKKGKPVLNLMKTEMGFGVDYMVGSHKWHGVAPNDDELAKALAQLPETIGDY